MRKWLHIIKLGWSYKIARSVHLAHPPYQYTIEPTNACNLQCDFCPQSDPAHKERRPPGLLSMDNFRLFLKRLDNVQPANKNLNFTLDGEPLLNKDFSGFVRLAAERGYFSVFASNGTLMDNGKVDSLAEAGPFRASIDFASDPQVFEKTRGREGDFELVRANLIRLMKMAKSFPGIHLDVHDITSFSGFDPEKSLQKLKKLFPDELTANSKQIRFDSRQFHNFCGHLDNRNDDSNYRLCPYPWTQMAVAHNGDCVACCRDTVGRSVLGNLFVDPIMEIWNGAKYQRFRQNLLDRKVEQNAACAKCDLPFSGSDPRWKLAYMFRSLRGR
ncbi:MAG: radical SAM protein [FCB group bacterium]|nr:radical SAM protein [FCB group bacterium]